MSRVRRVLGDAKAWVIAVALCVAVVLTGGGADAHTRPRDVRPVLHVSAVADRLCDGVTVVAYSLHVAHREAGRWVWAPLPDDGRATLEAHTAAGWRPVASRPGGEGRARVVLAAGVDAVRVVYPGPPAVVSIPALPEPAKDCDA